MTEAELKVYYQTLPWWQQAANRANHRNLRGVIPFAIMRPGKIFSLWGVLQAPNTSADYNAEKIC